jgi:hypothetical protein
MKTKPMKTTTLKTTLACLSLAAALASGVAAGACEKPSLPSVPDGATATQEELLSAQSRVRDYIAAMDLYIACENEAMRAGSGQTTADYLVLMSERIESAREEVDAVATRFNDQVEAFRSTRQGVPNPPR